MTARVVSSPTSDRQKVSLQKAEDGLDSSGPRFRQMVEPDPTSSDVQARPASLLCCIVIENLVVRIIRSGSFAHDFVFVFLSLCSKKKLTG